MKVKFLIILTFLIIFMFSFSLKFNNKYIKYEEDVYLAILVNGSETGEIPPKGHYNVNMICGNADAKWDYDNWKAIITNINGTAKCSLSFNSATPVNFATYIKGLSNADGVYNEPETDWRYEGKNPNNYLSFNDELWRIIGVFEENTHGRAGESLVKIIRADSIGGFAWNKTLTNNWATSSLYTLLNQYYYNGINETVITYCYSSGTTTKGNCDFTKNGITNGNYRDMIENVTWPLGSAAPTGNPMNAYLIERGEIVYPGRPISVMGYIGLMYPSDYGFSVLASSCSRDITLDKYATSICASGAWMNTGVEWTLMPHAESASYARYILDAGNLSTTLLSSGNPVRPVLYLKSDVQKIAGNGTVNNPYIIIR